MRVAMVLLAACVALAACGKRGPPLTPGPAEKVIYPKVYPSV